jgi:metal-responsive CopG/Arc/MetJ family transcriptional regulator
VGRGKRFAEDKKVPLSTAVRLSTLERLNELALRRNISRSELIEAMLLKALQEQEQEKS